jgi:putative nucleotidyltransferase with HDIG domain
MVAKAQTRGAQRLSAAFEAVEQLPALRDTRDRVLAAGLGNGAAPELMIEAVGADPGLAIAVIRRANQRINGAGPATTVSEGIARLGAESVNKIAAAIDTFDFLEQGSGPAAALERFRIHALATQRAADAVARRTGTPDREELLLVALLHDIGKLVIARLHVGELKLVDGSTPEDRLLAERREFGIDHALVGGVLGRRWGLPARMTSAIERHHSEDADGIAAMTQLADMLAHHDQGESISVARLRTVAESCGLLRSDLEELIYDQPVHSGPGHHSTEPSPLSAREMEVLRCLAEGKVYKQIALDLDLSVSTVRTHLHNVYSKLGVIDRAQAVLTATGKGWI